MRSPYPTESRRTQWPDHPPCRSPPPRVPPRPAPAVHGWIDTARQRKLAGESDAGGVGFIDRALGRVQRFDLDPAAGLEVRAPRLAAGNERRVHVFEPGAFVARGHHSLSVVTSAACESTLSPTFTATDFTTPATSLVSSLRIFIASMMTTGSPAVSYTHLTLPTSD